MADEKTSYESKNLVLCYHRGCGKKFDLQNNKDDDCIHHPGEPVFHDAYKIWPCCKKKCIDFTEFLNVKGCTKSCHSNEKTTQPVKHKVDKSKDDQVIEVYTQPINKESTVVRPSFDTPQVVLTPIISPSVYELIKGLVSSELKIRDETKISIGQNCKNKSCKVTYKGPESNAETCIHHPGIPVFHEGMKYWSCCQKKTSDFSVFLDQPGCTQGDHVWISETLNKKTQCRMDWHQTGSNVIISIYAKKYLPSFSAIKLSPIRLSVSIYFPEGDSRYKLDIELYKIIVVEKSKVNMHPSKVEITLVKGDPEYWHKLEIPHMINQTEDTDSKEKYEDTISAEVDSVDLSDL